jgi:hypothetical protein
VTREEWLLGAINILGKEKFQPLGYKFNKIRVSVGFPDTKKAVGQWWRPETTEDNHANIFIHPGTGDAVEILDILVHELCHDACGAKAGHGPIFKKCALAIGLEGKMRSASASKELKTYLKKLASRLGKFPHSALKKGAKGPTPKQTTRMIKMECGACGFICRASLSKILETGAPFCACSRKQMTVELPDEDNE